jgi:hypothetical protein
MAGIMARAIDFKWKDTSATPSISQSQSPCLLAAPPAEWPEPPGQASGSLPFLPSLPSPARLRILPAYLAMTRI